MQTYYLYLSAVAKEFAGPWYRTQCMPFLCTLLPFLKGCGINGTFCYNLLLMERLSSHLRLTS